MESQGYTPDAPFLPLPTRADAALPSQWWYFEGVLSAPGSLASLQVVFMAGLLAPGPTVPFFVTVAGTRPDGSRLPELFLPATAGHVARLEGKWDRLAGWKLEGGDTWVVQFDRPTSEKSAAQPRITGSMRLRRSVPGEHSPTADEHQVVPDGQLRKPLFVNDGIGWSTTVPGAHARVETVIDGQELTFEGSGFHDTNFFKGPWGKVIDDWYWTAGRAGPYTFVVYHFLQHGKGKWHTSGALWDAREPASLVDTWTDSTSWVSGQRVTCTPVVPWPETPGDIVRDEVLALRIEFSANERQWAFDMISTLTVVSGSEMPHGRWIAKTTGGVVHGGKQESESGTGSFDWFRF